MKFFVTAFFCSYWSINETCFSSVIRLLLHCNLFVDGGEGWWDGHYLPGAPLDQGCSGNGVWDWERCWRYTEEPLWEDTVSLLLVQDRSITRGSCKYSDGEDFSWGFKICRSILTSCGCQGKRHSPQQFLKIIVI